MITEDKFICTRCHGVRYNYRYDDFGEGFTYNEICKNCRQDHASESREDRAFLSSRLFAHVERS
jgi:hypothetical protein